MPGRYAMPFQAEYHDFRTGFGLMHRSIPCENAVRAAQKGRKWALRPRLGGAEQVGGGAHKRLGQSAVLHDFADVAVVGGADRRQFGRPDAPPSAFDAVIAEPRESEQRGRLLLRQAERAPPPADGRADRALRIVTNAPRPVDGACAEQPRGQRGAEIGRIGRPSDHDNAGFLWEAGGT